MSMPSSLALLLSFQMMRQRTAALSFQTEHPWWRCVCRRRRMRSRCWNPPWPTPCAGSASMISSSRYWNSSSSQVSDTLQDSFSIGLDSLVSQQSYDADAHAHYGTGPRHSIISQLMWNRLLFKCNKCRISVWNLGSPQGNIDLTQQGVESDDSDFPSRGR